MRPITQTLPGRALIVTSQALGAETTSKTYTWRQKPVSAMTTALLSYGAVRTGNGI